MVTCLPVESVQLTGPTENYAFFFLLFLFVTGKSFLLDPCADLTHPRAVGSLELAREAESAAGVMGCSARWM